jgi:hypothetical protein
MSPTDCLKDQGTEVKWSVSRVPYAPKGATGDIKKIITINIPSSDFRKTATKSLILILNINIFQKSCSQNSPL